MDALYGGYSNVPSYFSQTPAWGAPPQITSGPNVGEVMSLARTLLESLGHLSTGWQGFAGSTGFGYSPTNFGYATGGFGYGAVGFGGFGYGPVQAASPTVIYPSDLIQPSPVKANPDTYSLLPAGRSSASAA